MYRRLLLRALFFGTAWSSLTGCEMKMSKRNIANYGRTYDYLKDPLLRSKETSDAPLVVQGAEISGVSLQYLDWRNITFESCDFVGAYQLKLQSMTDVRFEGCRFSGIFGYGKCTNVHFLRCEWAGESNAYASQGSKNVLFESCRFVGTNTNPNHWGAVGSDGDAEFIGCIATLYNLDGHAKLVLRDCEFDEVECASFARESGGIYAPVLIDKCKMHGKFSMRNADLQSLTIRDTQLDLLDLNGATVKGDVMMERIKGGRVNVAIEKGARNFTLKDSQLYGGSSDINETNYVYAGAFKNILIDNCAFSSGLLDQTVVAGGFSLKNAQTPQPMLTQTLTIQNSKFAVLDTSFINAGQVVLQGNEIGMLDVGKSRIEKLEITGNTIARSVDLSHTQAKQARIQSLTKDQAKLEGSNIKLAR